MNLNRISPPHPSADEDARGRARTGWRAQSRRGLGFATAIVLSCGMTAVMCFAFHGAVRADFMTTGLICAVVIGAILDRVTGHYRRALASANGALERRVAERTEQLEVANQALRAAAAEQELLQQKLMVSDRMATAGQFAAGVSHEIRNPLTVIAFAVDEARERLQEASAGKDAALRDVRGTLDDIGAATAHIAVVLKDLSTLAMPIEEPNGPVDLGKVIDSASRLAAYQLREHGELERGPSDVPLIHGSSARLVQLVLNLMVNAAKAARPGVHNVVRVWAEHAGEGVVLSVSDTGTGMDVATMARLFEPFFTTRRERGGTGLGLAICRTIAEAVGGRIEVQSAKDRGTTMRVHLRISPAAAAAKAA